MIHAFLFIQNADRSGDHDAHGPQFRSMMEKINDLSGFKVTVYHAFVDEVDALRQHHWLCEGCRHLLKRAMNRSPGPSDWWWQSHQER